jgi:hypothetical protein
MVGFSKISAIGFLFGIFFILHGFVGQAQDQDTTAVEDESLSKAIKIELNDLQEILHRQEQADAFYQNGKLDSSLKMLAPYLKDRRLLKRYEKGGQAEIYRLAALNYILMDSLQEAEKSIKKVLGARHNYEVRQGDLLSFKAALDTMYISPRITIGLQIGWTGSIISRVNNYAVLYTAEENTKEEYLINYTGTTFGLKGGYYLGRHFSIATSVNFTAASFVYQTSFNPFSTTVNYEYTSKLNYIDVPLVLKYKILPKPYFTPYLFLGGFYRFSAAATKTIGATSIDILPTIQTHSYGLTAGVGISKSMGKRWQLSVDGRYLYNIGLINRPNKRFMNNGEGNIDFPIYNAYDVIDDLRMQNFQVVVGFSYLLRYKVF